MSVRFSATDGGVRGVVRFKFQSLALAALAMGGLYAVSQPQRPAAPAAVPQPQTVESVRSQIGGLRVPFVENRGQLDERVAFGADTFAGTVFVTRAGELVYSLPGEPDPSQGSQQRPAPKGVPAPARKPGAPKPGWVLTETLVGANALKPTGADPTATQISRFHGNDPNQWQQGLATFNQLDLGEAWPGVHVSLRAHGNNVEKLFAMRPGADEKRIRVRVGGANSIKLADDGRMLLATGEGDIAFTAPIAFQERGGAREPVEVAYTLAGTDAYGFTLGDHDPALPVVIDPQMQSTYLGGSSYDRGRALSIHPVTGEIYIAGHTCSTDFPGTAGGAQQALDGPCGETFVSRLDPGLTTILQSTYLGGSAVDYAYGLAIHPTTGDVYLAGNTCSTDFPATAGGAQSSHAPGECVEVFVSRLNAGLTAVLQSTYLGGSSYENAVGLAIHPNTGEVYVAGVVYSTDLPGTSGGAQPVHAPFSSEDAFVARLNAGLTTLLQSTYLGGTSRDQAFGLALHPTTGEVYVTGSTCSTDFPGTSGGAQSAHAPRSCEDVFLSRLNAELTTLLQSTYLGGSSSVVGPSEAGYGPAIHPTTGEVYVTGYTCGANFPGTAGGAQPTFNGNWCEAFVSRLNAGLTALLQSTYLGGSSSEYSFAIAIHPNTGEIYVSGQTCSTDFPGAAAGAQLTLNSCADAFVSRLNAALTTVLQSTYLGGSANEQPPLNALALHPQTGDVYLVGNTASPDFPGTAGGAQPAWSGGDDVFISRVSGSLRSADVLDFGDAPDPQYPTLRSSDGARHFIVNLFLGAAIDDETDGHPDANATGDDTNGSDDEDGVTFLDPIVVGGSFDINATVTGGDGKLDIFIDYNRDGDWSDSGEQLVGINVLAGPNTVSFDVPDDAVAGSSYARFRLTSAGIGTPTGSAADGEVEDYAIAILSPRTMSVAPASLTFADQVVTTQSDPQEVTVTNTGTKPLTLSGMTISAGFTYTSGCGAVLSVGQACTFDVRFAPGQAGPHTGSLSIASDADGSPHFVSLSGDAIAAAPSIALSTPGIDFGSQPVGRTSGQQTVTLTNNGNIGVTITGPSAGGDHPADFAVASNACGELAPAQSCTIAFTFTPGARGPRRAVETIRTNWEGAQSALNLGGIGTQPGAVLAPRSVDFGPQRVGTSSLSQGLTLTNDGNSALSVGSISAAGDFSQTHNCPLLLADGSSCTIEVTFTPAAEGSRNSALTIASDSPTSPDLVPLTGTGTQAHMTASGGLAFAARVVNTASAPLTVTVSNTGTAPMTVAAPTLGGTHRLDFTIASNSCSTVAPAGSCAMGITFRPRAIGARNATLTVASNAPESPITLPLSGTGQGRAVTLTAQAFVRVKLGQASVEISHAARLLDAATGQAIVNRVIAFRAGDTPTCSAYTAADGYARCGGFMKAVDVVPNLGYDAQFAGDALYLPNSAAGPLTNLGVK